MFKQEITIISSASGLGAGNPGCADGPAIVEASPFLEEGISPSLLLNWDGKYSARSPFEKTKKLECVAECCEEMAHEIEKYIEQKKKFMVLGGDHSCAVSTWSAVAKAYRTLGPIGLVWLDAHMDSHTSETSHTQNAHGMPLAALMGHGDALLTELCYAGVKVKPEHVVLIGVRSYEPEEKILLDRLGVKYVEMDEIEKRGLRTVFDEAISTVMKGTAGFGVSFDLDVMDPSEAPGVGTMVNNGIYQADLLPLLSTLYHNEKFICGEIAEFNPHLDEMHKTEKLIIKTINALYAGE